MNRAYGSLMKKNIPAFLYHQANGERNRFGLSLSYDIIKAHGGEIKVGSKEGEGTEFIIQLPVV